MFKIQNALFVAGLSVSLITYAQRKEQVVSFAVTNHHSAYPFSVFANLFAKDLHPGIEAGYGFNWKSKPKHDWYQTFRAGYFYHRFVQHAIPVYTQLSYRYKLSKPVHLTAALGADYLHAIPATAVLHLNDNGTYKKAKGIGRGQAILSFAAALQYIMHKEKGSALFLEYQQQLQTPFIKSYVPLLPYNAVALGYKVSLKTKN